MLTVAAEPETEKQRKPSVAIYQVYGPLFHSIACVGVFIWWYIPPAYAKVLTGSGFVLLLDVPTNTLCYTDVTHGCAVLANRTQELCCGTVLVQLLKSCNPALHTFGAHSSQERTRKRPKRPSRSCQSVGSLQRPPAVL